MIVQAIKKDGGLFIPDVGGIPADKEKITVELIIIDSADEKKKKLRATSGLLKNSGIDGIKYQHSSRDEWE